MKLSFASGPLSDKEIEILCAFLEMGGISVSSYKGVIVFTQTEPQSEQKEG